jgi:hypothetical protein
LLGLQQLKTQCSEYADTRATQCVSCSMTSALCFFLNFVM